MTERTPQELDPLGGITARLVVIAAGIFAVVAAVVMSIVGASQISSVPLAIAAILVLVATVVAFVRATSAFRPPLGLGTHFLVFGGSLLAVLLNALSQWGTNTYVRDDWGPVAMAIVIFSLGSYRAWPELLGSAVVSAVALAALAIAESGSLTTPVPLGVYALAAATPVLASGVAAAAFSATLVEILTAWRAGLGAGKPTTPARTTAVLADAAALSHLGYLHGEVIPFLESIAEVGEVGERDGPRARALSAELRALMVLDAEQSWAEELVDDLDDPAHLAARLSPGQRGSLRALVAHLRGAESGRDIRLVLRADGSGTLTARLAPGSNPRVRLAPFVAVVRGIFASADGDFSGTGFTLRFTL